MIINEWFRRILNLEVPHCHSCDILQKQLEIANYEKKELLDHILDFTKPHAEEKEIVKEIQPIRPRAVPFSVKKQMLEAEDRVRAEILNRKEKELHPVTNPDNVRSIEELEKELGIHSESVEGISNG